MLTRTMIACLALIPAAILQAQTSSVTVIDPTGKPVKGATVCFVHPDKKIYASRTTDEKGKAVLRWEHKGSLAVFCAHREFRAYRKGTHNPNDPLEIKLRTQLNTGSIICPDGSGNVPGLTGRLCPILDTYNRLYLYADNISLNDGAQQPIRFALNSRIKAEDQNGHRFDLTIIDIIGKTSLIEFKKKK